MDKRNKFWMQVSSGCYRSFEAFYTAAIFDELGNADVCLCQENQTRVCRVITRIYDAEHNRLAVV